MRPPALLDAAGVLVVLVAQEALVEEADALEQRLAPAAEGHGVDVGALLALAKGAGGGEAAAGGEGEHARPAAVGAGRGVGGHADEIGAVALERAHEHLDVVGRIHGVGVGAHDDLAARGGDAAVHRVRRGARRVGDDAQAAILPGEPLEDLARAVVGVAVDGDDLHLAGGEAAGEERAERALDEAPLVVARHHDGDARRRRRRRRHAPVFGTTRVGS